MSAIARIVNAVRKRARAKRAKIFLQNFCITAQAKILDIGSEDGLSIASVLRSTGARPENVFIADINEELVKKGQARYGLMATLIAESGKLPFEDKSFDVVYCSSVIEHVTVPKTQVW